MPETPQYGKVYTIHTYYDGKVASEKTEVEIQKATSKRTFLADVIDLTADVLNGDCKELNLTITSDDQGVKLITMTKRQSLQKGYRYKKG